MFTCGGFGYGFWWIFPVFMLILCFLMMRRMGCMMGRHNMQNTDNLHKKDDVHLKKTEGG